MNQQNFLLPAVFAKKVTVDDSLTTASAETITLAEQVKIIRVIVLDNSIFLKWGATAITTSNFDVPLAQGVNDLSIPTGVTQLQLLGDTGTAKYRVAQY